MIRGTFWEKPGIVPNFMKQAVMKVVMRSFVWVMLFFLYSTVLQAQEEKVDPLLHLKELALQGNAEAMYYLGGICYSQTPPDYVQAAEWFRKAAESDYAGGQYLLGVLFSLGRGVPESREQACYWLKKAASSKDSVVSLKAGKLLKQCFTRRDSTGMESDQKCSGSAGMGNAEAEYFLALLLLEGRTGNRDTLEALRLMRSAATQEYAAAQFYFGRLREKEGQYQEAVKWYEQAAKQGFPEAEYNLGVMYYWGKGVSEDKERALEWTAKAAKQGVIEAQYNLGIMYYVRRNYKESEMWLTKAASQGHAQARQELKKLMRP